MKYQDKNKKKLRRMTINLGLCCINTELRKENIFNSRNCIRRTYTIEKAKKLAIQNIKDLIPMIEYNHKNNIKCFRLSSNMFPRFTDSEVEKYDIDFAKPYLKKAGALAKKYGIRILMHPAQFNQVGAENNNVFQNTIFELSHHADILDEMGIDKNGVLIVHGGGRYGDKETTIKRWVQQYFLLPKKVRNRLVIENCERNYSIEDVLYISKQIEKKDGFLPVVFDNHHYNCFNHIYDVKFPEYYCIEEILSRVILTWKDKKPLMHISEQGNGKIGHHSDFIETIPYYYFWIAEELDISFDLEVEAKMKEQAIFRLYNIYPEFFKKSKIEPKKEEYV